MFFDPKGGALKGLALAQPTSDHLFPARGDRLVQTHQELTLSYMCEKDPAPPPDAKAKETQPPDSRFLDRDFLRLGEPTKRTHDASDSPEAAAKKKTKSAAEETPNLSLAPPPLRLDPAGYLHAAASRRGQSSSNTRASSDDFSRSCSLSFSHNLSCSLTRNTSENFESSRDTDGVWRHGEGTNGSVHSRFRPILDGYRPAGADNVSSFFPSTLPARPATRSDAAMDVRPDRILGEIVSGAVPVVARMLKELPGDAVGAVKDHLRSLLADAGKKDALAKIQLRLERRSDLTFEVLLKSNENQLDILVAARTGIAEYLSQKLRRPTRELAEIFLLARCRNPACNSELPVEDCDCRICTTTKGFCSSCTCTICNKFDCALKTCTWVGCDVCSHWCHAVCAIQKNLIRPGPPLKGAQEVAEVLSYCPGCGHASEMLGFAKAVFAACAKDWSPETLKREVGCIVQIFQVGVDVKGMLLHRLGEKILSLLEKKLISSVDACNAIIQFLNYGKLEECIPGSVLKDLLASAAPAPAPSKPVYSNTTPSHSSREAPLHKDTMGSGKKPCAAAFASATPKVEGFESIESMVQFKQAEVVLFQRLADEASREVEAYRQMIKVGMQKLEEEYASKHVMLCIKEIEERRCRKQEELKLLENSHHDYYRMKKRMEVEMASLLQRMEMTKQQLVPL